jgi:hypothetical protein
VPPTRKATGVAIILIGALLAIAAATTPRQPPHAGHATPVRAADAAAAADPGRP